MKKLLLGAVALVMCFSAAAQIGFSYDKAAMLKAIATSDEDIANPKRNGRGQTWLDRGDAMFLAAGGYMLSGIVPGTAEKAMILALGKSEPTPTQVMGRAMQKYSYPFAEVYVMDGVVQFWTLKETVYAGAAEKAVEAYNKAVALDAKLTEKATAGLTGVGDVVSIEANGQYNLGNRAAAAEGYWQAFNIKKEPLVGKIDSISVFNAGYIMLTDGNYDKAIEILRSAIDNGVLEDGKTQYFLAYAYLQQDKNDEAKKVLDDGLKRFPGNNELITSMISYYAKTGGDFGEIKSLLETALANDKTNQALWNGLGQVYLNGDDNEASIEYFTDYVAAFPDAAESNYFLGDAWYAKASALTDANGGTPTDEALVAYRNAWKYLKASYDAEPLEKATVQRLYYTTYRIQKDAGMADFFKEIEAEYKAMGE